MSDEERKLSVVPFAAKMPAKREPDVMAALVQNHHRMSVLLDEQVGNWERWGDLTLLRLRVIDQLLEAGRVDEAQQAMRDLVDQSEQMQKQKRGRIAPLPPCLR